jgi:hypothetical protein
MSVLRLNDLPISLFVWSLLDIFRALLTAAFPLGKSLAASSRESLI